MREQYTEAEILHLIARVNKDFSHFSLEEQKEAIHCYQITENKILLNALVQSNEGLVYKMTMAYKQNTNYEDILQEARIGLIMAIKKYDVNLDFKFSTFASRYIYGYALRYAEGDLHIHIPAYIYDDIRKYEKYLIKNPNASEKEILTELNISKKSLNELKFYMNNRILDSLNDLMITKNEETKIEHIFNLVDDGPTPDKIIEEKERKDSILNILLRCAKNENQEYMLKNFFGFDGDRKTCDEIAKKLGCHRSNVNGLTIRTIRKLREPLEKRKIRDKLGIPYSISDLDVVDYVFRD